MPNARPAARRRFLRERKLSDPAAARHFDSEVAAGESAGGLRSQESENRRFLRSKNRSPLNLETRTHRMNPSQTNGPGYYFRCGRGFGQKRAVQRSHCPGSWRLHGRSGAVLQKRIRGVQAWAAGPEAGIGEARGRLGLAGERGRAYAVLVRG